MTYAEIAAREVEWYRQHGQHPRQRVVRDSHRIEYVIGDWSWNRGDRPREFIEDAMHAGLTNPEGP